MNESSGRNWQIEHQCPRCGAPVLLEETDRILSCGYCRVRLYIRVKDHARYCLAPGKAPARDLFFVPYWRFKGLVFSRTGVEIEQKVIDVSSLALESGDFPPSLGVRPQVLKLRFVKAGKESVFLRPRLPFRAERQAKDGAAGVNAHLTADRRPDDTIAEIGETLSLIYTPVYLKDGSLYDAVLDRPFASAPEGDLRALESDPHPEGKIDFLPTLCPHCGWDLSGEKDAAVLLCRNCTSAWIPSEAGFEPLPFRVLHGGGEADLHLPFWRMRAQVAGLKLESRADLIRLANLPRQIRPEWEETGPDFWIPAFKVQPHLFLRLARQFTLTGSEAGSGIELPRARLFPATLPAAEAAESIKVAIASIAMAKRLILPRLPEIRVKIEECALVYVPFKAQGSEWIQPAMQIAVNGNALDLGRAI